ncbi:MAG: hypothetical protein WAM39_03125 [Bryobacteraceae bacterium]
MSHIAYLLFALFEAADRTQSTIVSFTSIDTPGRFFLHSALQVEAQLFFELVLYPAAAKNGS